MKNNPSGIELYTVIAAITMFCLFFFSPRATGVTIKASAHDGGHQIWFEAEEYDDRDSPEHYLSATKEAKVPLEKGVFNDAMVFVPDDNNIGGIEGSKDWWGEYIIQFLPGREGIWYFWGRISAPGDGAHDSMYVWAGTKKPANKPIDVGDANMRVFNSHNAQPAWMWVSTKEGDGDNPRPLKLERTRNIILRMYERESGLTSQRLDVLCLASSKSYLPSDKDYQDAKTYLAVNHFGKLATTWADIKWRFSAQ